MSKLVEVSHFLSSLAESVMSAKVSKLVKVSHFGAKLVIGIDLSDSWVYQIIQK